MKITFLHVLINQVERPHSPPLGPLYLVSVLREAGFDVSFRQFAHVKGTPLRCEDLARSMSGDAEVLAISSMIDALPLILMTLARVRRLEPGRTVVAGGPGYEGIGEKVLKTFDVFDIVARGESESNVVPLMQAIRDGSDLGRVPGICYRDGDDMRTTPRPKRIENLDSLPLPAFDLVNFSDYRYVPMIASRGCPFRCTFCDVAPAWGRLHRCRSPENLLSEMAALAREHGVTKIGFVDDLFVVDRRWVRRFCELKIASGLTTEWRCNGHVNLMDEDMLDLMKAAGCVATFFGIESGSDRVLKKIKKAFTVEKALETVERTLSRFPVHTNLLWGFPFETEDDLRQTLALRRRLTRMGVEPTLVMLAPLASSPLYSEKDPLHFDPDVPNMFYADYADLEESVRPGLNALLRSDSHIFSAFHHFPSPYLDKAIELVSFETILDRTLIGLSEAERIWQTV